MLLASELDRAALTEPSPAPEIFCNGLAAIELIGGGCARFYLYSNQTPVEAGAEGYQERVVVCKIVAPIAAVPAAVRLMSEAAQMAETGVVPNMLS